MTVYTMTAGNVFVPIHCFLYKVLPAMSVDPSKELIKYWRQSGYICGLIVSSLSGKEGRNTTFPSNDEAHIP